MAFGQLFTNGAQQLKFVAFVFCFPGLFSWNKGSSQRRIIFE